MKLRIGLLIALSVVLLLASWPATIATSGKNFFPQMVSDGASGAVISWLKKNDDCYEVYTQRIDSDGDIHDNWPSGGQVVSIMSGADHIGHRLNHHLIPGWYDDNGIQNEGHAISFWANHFHVHEQTPYYDRGYYLQRTNATGGLVWNDEDPVQVLQTWPVPESKDGEPISICLDGEGGCVVAMRAGTNSSGGQQYGAWKIWIARYDAAGGVMWKKMIYEIHVSYHNLDEDPELEAVYEHIGCPKVEQWENDASGNPQFMVLWVSVSDASAPEGEAAKAQLNSVTTLHLCKVDKDGNYSDDESTVYYQASSANPIYASPGEGYYKWYWWFPDFQVTTNTSRDKLFVAFRKQLKRRWSCGDTPSWTYREDSLYILQYSSPSSYYNPKGLEGFSWRGTNAHNFNGDWCPLRSPSIICVNDAAVVCVPRSTDNPPQYGNNPENYPRNLIFHLKTWKVQNGTATHLWDKNQENYHSPKLVTDPSGGLILAYSKYPSSDYLNGIKSSSVVVEHHYPITQATPNWIKNLNSYTTNVDPQMVLSDNHVIVTWSASTDGVSSNSWLIMAQRYDMSGNP